MSSMDRSTKTYFWAAGAGALFIVLFLIGISRPSAPSRPQPAPVMAPAPAPSKPPLAPAAKLNPKAKPATPQWPSASERERLAQRACELSQRAVRKQLIAPSTAKFPGCVWGRHEYEIRADPAQKTFWVFGHVDAQNVYGAMLRHEWGVKLVRSGADDWTVARVEVE